MSLKKYMQKVALKKCLEQAQAEQNFEMVDFYMEKIRKWERENEEELF